MLILRKLHNKILQKKKWNSKKRLLQSWIHYFKTYESYVLLGYSTLTWNAWSNEVFMVGKRCVKPKMPKYYDANRDCETPPTHKITVHINFENVKCWCYIKTASVNTNPLFCVKEFLWLSSVRYRYFQEIIMMLTKAITGILALS